jgi:pimeloyl-ACP methyl ester carboxylesterase
LPDTDVNHLRIATVVTAARTLAPELAAALDTPAPPDRWSARAAGYTWHGLRWGADDLPPVVLMHGITSDSGTWWRMGSAIAASGRRVLAIDMPGHGRTRWRRRHRFADTAEDVARLIETVGLERPAIIAHSWGAMVAVSLPALGVMPRPLVLLDPPSLDEGELEAMSADPEDMPARPLSETARLLRRSHPDWSDQDVTAKARAVFLFDREAVRSILLGNGVWDSGLARCAANGPAVETWLLRGEPATGGLTPDAVAARFRERIGAERVMTIEGGPHSPHRTHPAETLRAILRAFGRSDGPG